jgi:signal transduction histidine kinase
MERAQRLVDADASSALLKLLAHDLREPFGPLGLALSMLAENVSGADTELLRMAEANCARIVRMIDAVLLAMRPHGVLELQPADLAEIAESAAEAARAMGTPCTVRAGSCPVDAAPQTVRDVITGLLECVLPGQIASITVQPHGDRATFELRAEGVDWSAGVAGAVPSDRRSAFVLACVAVFGAHGGAMEVTDGTVAGWIPIRS